MAKCVYMFAPFKRLINIYTKKIALVMLKNVPASDPKVGRTSAAYGPSVKTIQADVLLGISFKSLPAFEVACSEYALFERTVVS